MGRRLSREREAGGAIVDLPELSRFFGIVITMHYNDHPPPHFHVRYGAHKALVAIDDLTVLRGSLLPGSTGWS